MISCHKESANTTVNYFLVENPIFWQLNKIVPSIKYLIARYQLYHLIGGIVISIEAIIYFSQCTVTTTL